MKQVIIQKGVPVVHDVPLPTIQPGMLLVRNEYSIISTGTEGASIQFSKKSLLEKVFTEREKMHKGLKMLREKGFQRTYQFVKGMLDFGVEVGYASSGEVIEIGEGVEGFARGDRVSCAGAQYAHHAEYVLVPVHLCAKVPGEVASRDAASGTLGAIALQGVRQAGLSLGESAVVVGLGLLGQLAVQMLVRSGVTVYGVDIDDSRIALAKEFGISEGFRADDPELSKKILFATDGYGADATLLYAATPSSVPLNAAMSYTRKRGRVVIVGSVGLTLNRSPWYEKEIDVRISTSYGPGRYDERYERDGIDYPFAYVRWTEQRNIEAYLAMLQKKSVVFSPLVQKEFPLDDAALAYGSLAQKPLAVALRYSAPEKNPSCRAIPIFPLQKKEGALSMGVIGLGAFALSTHLPNLARMKDRLSLRALASSNGAKAKQYGLQYEAEYVTTDYRELLQDRDLDAVLIATRHDSHARIVCDSLAAGKHVFVEKPLALTLDELSEIERAMQESGRILMAGFNRRFSPYIASLAERVKKRKHPLVMVYRVNAGYLPPEHWTQGTAGGGRIIGEACHMLDVFSALVGHPVQRFSVNSLRNSSYYQSSDNLASSLEYSDGSLATLCYTALGHPSLPKEYLEVYSDGAVYAVSDFSELKTYGAPPITVSGFNKGHSRELELFADAVKQGNMPIPFESIREVTRLSIQINDALKGVLCAA